MADFAFHFVLVDLASRSTLHLVNGFIRLRKSSHTYSKYIYYRIRSAASTFSCRSQTPYVHFQVNGPIVHPVCKNILGFFLFEKHTWSFPRFPSPFGKPANLVHRCFLGPHSGHQSRVEVPTEPRSQWRFFWSSRGRFSRGTSSHDKRHALVALAAAMSAARFCVLKSSRSLPLDGIRITHLSSPSPVDRGVSRIHLPKMSDTTTWTGYIIPSEMWEDITSTSGRPARETCHSSLS